MKGTIMICTDDMKRIAVTALLSGGMALAAVGLGSGIAQASDDQQHITPSSHPPIYAPVHANPHRPGSDLELNPLPASTDSRH
jgi:hypothetical protein